MMPTTNGGEAAGGGDDGAEGDYSLFLPSSPSSDDNNKFFAHHHHHHHGGGVRSLASLSTLSTFPSFPAGGAVDFDDETLHTCGSSLLFSPFHERPRLPPRALVQPYNRIRIEAACHVGEVLEEGLNSAVHKVHEAAVLRELEPPAAKKQQQWGRSSPRRTVVQISRLLNCDVAVVQNQVGRQPCPEGGDGSSSAAGPVEVSLFAALALKSTFRGGGANRHRDAAGGEGGDDDERGTSSPVNRDIFHLVNLSTALMLDDDEGGDQNRYNRPLVVPARPKPRRRQRASPRTVKRLSKLAQPGVDSGNNQQNNNNDEEEENSGDSATQHPASRRQQSPEGNGAEEVEGGGDTDDEEDDDGNQSAAMAAATTATAGGSSVPRWQKTRRKAQALLDYHRPPRRHPCPFGCGICLAGAKKLEEHKVGCKFRVVECPLPDCSQSFKFLDARKHDAECSSKNSQSMKQVRRKARMTAHILASKTRPEKCALCGTPLMPRMKKQHQEEFCPRRTVSCQYEDCSGEFEFCEQDQHRNVCTSESIQVYQRMVKKKIKAKALMIANLRAQVLSSFAEEEEDDKEEEC